MVPLGQLKSRGRSQVFDPWAELTKHPNVEVRIERLNGQVVGLTNGVDRIWLDDRLNQVERRCVLTHEIRHVQLGHANCQPLAVEMKVCAWVARKLISMEDLARALPWSHDLYELAAELHVTPQTLRDRLHGMSVAENRLLSSWELMRAA